MSGSHQILSSSAMKLMKNEHKEVFLALLANSIESA